jgi:hypothetical protein
MQWQLDKRTALAGLVACTLIMLLVGWESHRDTARIGEASDVRKHGHEVLMAINDTETRLVDAETGQRGYLLTGDHEYLEPYWKASRGLDQALSGLKNLIADDADQQKRFLALEPLIQNKLTELQTTIDLRDREGFAAANQVVVTGQGRQWMDQIRVILAGMVEEENARRAIHTQEMTKALTRSSRTVVFGNLFSILLLWTVFSLLLLNLSLRRRAQEALEKSEKWSSTTLASVGDAVIATDMDGAVTFMNPVAQALTGWSPTEALGKSMDLVFDIVNAETRRPVENPVKKVFREGKVVGLADHTLLLSKNGAEFDIEDSAAPILTDKGDKFGVVLVFRDISQKKKTEQETVRQTELLQLILTSIADGVVVADSSGKFLLFNEAAQKFLGTGATETGPSTWSDRYGTYLPDTITPYPSNELPLVRAMRGESVDAVEVFIRNRKVPEGRLLSITGRPLRRGDASLVGGVVVLHDITERKRAEQTLRQSEERYHLLFDSNPHPVWVYDLQTFAIVDVNPAAVRNYGYTREEFLSLTIKDIRPPEDVPSMLENAANTPPIETTGTWRHRKKDGSLIDVEITSHPLAYDGRNARLVVATDITVRKKAEEELRQAKEEAERGSKFKDQFLATMSHELRTPLNAVLGFSDLLADERYGTLSDRQQRYVNHIHTGGQHLLKLISDILDLSKIEAGRMELARENVTVSSAVSEVLSALQPLADKKGQSLVQQVEPHLKVFADSTRFKQVLMNLVGNAIKFTPDNGHIEIAARRENHQVRMEVRDDGPGIASGEQQRIFEAFVRLAESGGSAEGTGLGLAISARLVELHGSTLAIESQPGAGTCFYFSLPLVATTLEPPEQPHLVPPRSGTTPRILIVEDSASTGQLIQSQLTSSGYETRVCDRPEHATDMAAEFQPDAITLDLLMKPVHGLEVLLQLKNDPRTQRIPVIVVSITDEPAIGSALGADEYLVKPVDKSTLLAAVERCLRSRGGVAPLRAILVVEDDVSTREMIVELLTAYGYAVTTAADGVEARESVNQSLPELIILDLVLPKMSGFDLLAEWRGNPRTAELSVFVLTSKDLTKDEEKYVRAHAESLFRKQNSWREPLIRQLERIVTATPVQVGDA